jgi:hypothetical protein
MRNPDTNTITFVEENAASTPASPNITAKYLPQSHTKKYLAIKNSHE